MKINKSFIISYHQSTIKSKSNFREETINPRDEFNLRKLLEYLSKVIDNQSEVIIVEQGKTQTITWLDEIDNIQELKYYFVESDVFNKGKGYNIGVSKSKGKFIILHNLTSYLKLSSYANIYMLNSYDVINSFFREVNLNEEESNDFLTDFNFDNLTYNKLTDNNSKLISDILFIKRDKYVRTNGFDEKIKSFDNQKVAFKNKIIKLKLDFKIYNDFAINVISKGEDNTIDDSPIYDDVPPSVENRKSISVIVTAYKAYNFIEECLDSIENQTYFQDFNNYEVLLGIDACEDTLYVVNKIKSKYRNLKIFMMSSNKGTYITSNTLIDNASHSNIIRFDSDDIMLPEMITVIMNTYDNKNVIRPKYYLKIDDDVYNKDQYQGYPNGIGLFRKELFNGVGGYQPWVYLSDVELLVRGSSIINEKLINKELYYKRLHINSLSQIINSRKIRLFNIYKKLIGKHDSLKIKREINSYILIH